VNLKDGRVVDGHMEENGKDEIVILGRYAKDAHDLLDLHERKDLAKPAPIKIERSEIAEMNSYGPWHNTYTAIYFTLTGLHALHVIGGAIVIFYLWAFGGKMWKTDPERFTNRVEISGLFWHFVDLVWIFLFPVLYLL
jgi:cytochrome c oxidase subunit 3